MARGCQPNTQGPGGAQAQAAYGPGRPRPHRRTVVCTAGGVGRVCLLRSRRPPVAAGLCAGAVPWWPVHAGEHRARLWALQRQQVQRRGHRMDASETTRRADLPVAVRGTPFDPERTIPDRIASRRPAFEGRTRRRSGGAVVLPGHRQGRSTQSCRYISCLVIRRRMAQDWDSGGDVFHWGRIEVEIVL